MGLDRIHQRPQGHGRGADPVGERGHIERDTFMGVGRALPVERQMQAILGKQNVGEQSRSGAPASDGVERCRGWLIASQARQGSRFSVSRTSNAEPSKPLRISVWPGRKPNLRARGERDRHREPSLSAASTADTVAASAAPLIRIRTSGPSSISIEPPRPNAASLGSAAIATAAKPGAAAAFPHSCWRQRNTRVATRFEKTARNYLAIVTLAAIILWGRDNCPHYLELASRTSLDKLPNRERIIDNWQNSKIAYFIPIGKEKIE